MNTLQWRLAPVITMAMLCCPAAASEELTAFSIRADEALGRLPYTLAQEPVIIDEDDGQGDIIFEDDGAGGGQTNILEYLDIQGLIGGSSSSSLTRNFSYIRLGARYSWENLGIFDSISVFGNVLATDVSANATLALTNFAMSDQQLCQNDPIFLITSPVRCADLDGLAPELRYTVEIKDSQLDEFFVNFGVSDQLSIIAGKNRLTWGQFAFLSPVHLLLPINTETQLGFSKVDSRLPQQMVIVDYYPTERLQLQLSAVLTSDIDPAVEKYFEIAFRDEIASDPLRRFAPGYDGTADAQDIFAEHTQMAFRAIYTPNWGAYGVTMWEGPLHFFVNENLALPTCITADSFNCDPGTNFFSNAAPNLPLSEAVAFEIAYNIGNWTLIAEISSLDSTSDLDLERVLEAAGTAGTFSNSQRAQDARNLLSTLVRVNRGLGTYDSSFVLAAIGADGTSPSGKWTYNLELFMYSPGGGGNVLDALRPLPKSFDPNYDRNQEEDLEQATFPTFHISRAGTVSGRPATWGVGLGFFLHYGGLFTYYNVEVTENLSIQGGIEALERTSENDSAQDDNPNYGLSDSSAPALSFALQMRF